MHILVINDDGPPSNQTSPYIHAFIATLQNAGHLVSVVLPHEQRSWIGKAHFDSDVDLYSCNVPLVKGVETNKVMLTHALQNYWTSGSSFEEVEATEHNEDPEIREKEIREGSGGGTDSNEKPTRHKHRHFKWAPKFGDIQKSIDASPPGNDGWAIHNNYTRFFVPLLCAP
ncbi:hypothetical protein P7C71_g1649, partial [Lecanoromycetidae sp. Uapishka_2]